MGGRLYYLFLIHLAQEKKEALKQYEHKIKPLLERHGGRFEMILTPHLGDNEIPGEIHLISMPDQESWVAFKEDPEVQSQRAERADIIKRVEMIPCWQYDLKEYFT